MLYLMTGILDQHVPGISGFHTFSKGVHWPQVKAMLRPRETLTETMMNHTKRLIQPSEMRSTVIANDVLLHAAARMAAVPARLENRRKSSRLSELKSHIGRPRPSGIVTDTKAHCATRASYILIGPRSANVRLSFFVS